MLFYKVYNHIQWNFFLSSFRFPTGSMLYAPAWELHSTPPIKRTDRNNVSNRTGPFLDRSSSFHGKLLLHMELLSGKVSSPCRPWRIDAEVVQQSWECPCGNSYIRMNKDPWGSGWGGCRGNHETPQYQRATAVKFPSTSSLIQRLIMPLSTLPSHPPWGKPWPLLLYTLSTSLSHHASHPSTAGRVKETEGSI